MSNVIVIYSFVARLVRAHKWLYTGVGLRWMQQASIWRISPPFQDTWKNNHIFWNEIGWSVTKNYIKTQVCVSKLGVTTQLLVQSLVSMSNSQNTICYPHCLWTRIKCVKRSRSLNHVYLYLDQSFWVSNSPLTSMDPSEWLVKIKVTLKILNENLDAS